MCIRDSPNTYVWRVPDDMPNDVAALLDPLAVAVRSIELAQTCPGMLEEAFSTTSTVVVVGSGPVGVLTCLLARIMAVSYTHLDVYKRQAQAYPVCSACH